MTIIKTKFLKIIAFAFILFLCAGIASAHENNTSELSSGANLQSDNIKELIDNCKDNDIVKLEDKTYYLDDSNETRIILNKSVTVEGIDGKTVIDGNNTSLFLDVNKTEEKIDEPYPVMYMPDGYVLKNLGKNVTFKNIAFKDLKMETWHEMTFENCRFINSTFTSYEYSNTFKNCTFEKSVMEIVLFYANEFEIYKDYSKIIGCSFNESLITFKGVQMRNYIQLIGGDPFRITNSLDLINSSLYNSNITLYRNNISICNSNFSKSRLQGTSDFINIENSNFENPQIELGYSIMSVHNSEMENPKFELNGGYFSIGCDLILENATLSNCKLKTRISFGTRTGNLKINNSKISNSTFNLTDKKVLLENSTFSRSSFEFFFSDANIRNCEFANDGNITDTLKTIRDKIVYTSKDNEIFTPSLIECQVKTNYVVENSHFTNSSGRFEIKAETVNMDTTYRISVINEKDIYYFNDKLTIKVEDCLGNPVSGLELFIEDLNDYTYPTPSVKTDSNGTAEYRLNKLGNLRLEIYYETYGALYSQARYGIDLNLTVKSQVSDITVKKVNFNKNIYSNIKGYLEIKSVANSSANLKDLKFSYKVFTKGKSKTYYSTSNSKGVATFKLPKALTAGSHKIEIRLMNTNIKKTVTVKIAKAKTTVKAPKVTAKFKKSRYFKVTVKNKATKKAVSNVKVKIKVYTGKKYKTYTVKTNKKGIAKINTKKLKVGKHKVAISSGNGNYHISAKSRIAITWN